MFVLIEKQMRQRFGQNEDYLLVLQVKVDAPYKARHGAIGETWDSIAERLNQHPDFHMRPIKGTTAKARFDTLLLRHRKRMESAGFEESNSPFGKIMSELVKEVDLRPKGNARLGEEDEGQQDDEKAVEPRTRIRLGKRRSSASVDVLEVEPPARREIFMLPRASGTKQMQSLSGPAAEIALPVTELLEKSAGPQKPIAGDIVTVQQAMAELLRMQHAFATRPNEVGVLELEKINEARLREEEEKTKQRGLELQIEMQRTRRRQLELEFEKEERKKDREEQAKLIVSLVERLEPTRNGTLADRK